MHLNVRLGLGKVLLPIILAAFPAVLSAQTGTISGRVIHEATGTGVPSVQITIPDLKISALTAGDGSFTLNGVRAGQYEVRAIRIGFTASSAPVSVTAGQTATVEIKMVEAALECKLDFFD